MSAARVELTGALRAHTRRVRASTDLIDACADAFDTYGGEAALYALADALDALLRAVTNLDAVKVIALAATLPEETHP